ncbi:hypothetical protein CSUI_007622 [Cystoisospora suis]|uniref:Uncharacterized protein n=1 Tax=Cystoisospora suis TaxID=483139 RepID=A0A2C6JTT8_9APIC|nr:hypothetical protein CSUI_007622 [Cystoisospora suis]
MQDRPQSGTPGGFRMPSSSVASPPRKLFLGEPTSYSARKEVQSYAVTGVNREAEDGGCPPASSLSSQTDVDHAAPMRTPAKHDEFSSSSVSSSSSRGIAGLGREDGGDVEDQRYTHTDTSGVVYHPHKKTSFSSPSSPRSSRRAPSLPQDASSSPSSTGRDTSLDYAKKSLQQPRENPTERSHSRISPGSHTPSSFFFWKWGGGGGGGGAAVDGRGEDKKKNNNPSSASSSSHIEPSHSSSGSYDVLEWSRSESLPPTSSTLSSREREERLERQEAESSSSSSAPVGVRQGEKDDDHELRRMNSAGLPGKFARERRDEGKKQDEEDGSFLGFPKKSTSHSHHTGGRNSSFVMAQAKKFKKMTVAFMMQGGKRLSSAPSSHDHGGGDRRNSTSSDRSKNTSDKDKRKKKKDLRYDDGEGDTRRQHSRHKEDKKEINIFTDRLVGEDALTRNSLDLTGWMYPSSTSSSSGRFSHMWSFSGGGDLPSNIDEAGPQLVDRHSLSTGMTPPGGVYGHSATAQGGHHSSSHACPRVLPFAEIFRMFNPHIPQPLGIGTPRKGDVSEDTTTPATGIDFGHEGEEGEDEEEVQGKEEQREEERACYEAVEEIVDEALSHLESLHKEKEGKFLEDLENQEEQRVKSIEEEEQRSTPEKEVVGEKEEEGEDNSDGKECELFLREGSAGLVSSAERCMNDELNSHAVAEEGSENEKSADEVRVGTPGEGLEISGISHEDQRERTSETDPSGVGEETEEGDGVKGLRGGEEEGDSPIPHSGVCTTDSAKNVDTDGALQGDCDQEEHTLNVRESQIGVEESEEEREMNKEREMDLPCSRSSPSTSAEQGPQQEGERGSGVHTPQALGEQSSGDKETSHSSSSVSASPAPSPSHFLSNEEDVKSIDRKIAREDHDFEELEVEKEAKSEDFDGCLKAPGSSSFASKLISPHAEESGPADTQAMQESGTEGKEAEEEERRKERQDVRRDDGQVNGDEEKTSFSVSLPKEGEEEPLDGDDRKKRDSRQKEEDRVSVGVSLNEIPASDVTTKKEDEQEDEEEEGREDKQKKEKKMRGERRKDKLLPNDGDDSPGMKRSPLLPCPSREGLGPASEENGDGDHLSSSRRSSLSERRASYWNSKSSLEGYRHLGGSHGEEDSDNEGSSSSSHKHRRGVVLGQADFPEWLMQIDGGADDSDEDGRNNNPYKHVRLRKVGLQHLQKRRVSGGSGGFDWSCPPSYRSSQHARGDSIDCPSVSYESLNSQQLNAVHISPSSISEKDEDKRRSCLTVTSSSKPNQAPRERSSLLVGRDVDNSSSSSSFRTPRADRSTAKGAGMEDEAVSGEGGGGEEEKNKSKRKQGLTAAERFRLEQERREIERQRRIELEKVLEIFEERKKNKEGSKRRGGGGQGDGEAVEKSRQEGDENNNEKNEGERLRNSDLQPPSLDTDGSRQLSVSALRARFEKNQKKWFKEQLHRYNGKNDAPSSSSSSPAS